MWDIYLILGGQHAERCVKKLPTIQCQASGSPAKACHHAPISIGLAVRLRRSQQLASSLIGPPARFSISRRYFSRHLGSSFCVSSPIPLLSSRPLFRAHAAGWRRCYVRTPHPSRLEEEEDLGDGLATLAWERRRSTQFSTDPLCLLLIALTSPLPLQQGLGLHG